MTLCKCGCGKSVPIAKSTCKQEGRIKGQPCPSLPGHYIRPSHRYVRDWSDLEELYTNQKLSTVEIGVIKNCSSTCVGRMLREGNIHVRSMGECAIVRGSKKRSWNLGLTKATDERVKGVAKKLSGRKRAPFSIEALKNMGLAQKGKHHTPEVKAKISAAHVGLRKGCKLTPEHKKKIGEQSKKLWQNPEYVRKTIAAIIKGNNQPMTKPEKVVLDIINRYKLPLEWTGAGKVIINGMIPDFTNVNGGKEVVEVFGDYWHSEKMASNWKRTELGRIMAYKAFGFNCIVIWEHEIKTMTEEEMVGRLVH